MGTTVESDGGRHASNCKLHHTSSRSRGHSNLANMQGKAKTGSVAATTAEKS